MKLEDYERIKTRQHGFCDDCFPKYVRYREVLKTDPRLKRYFARRGLV
jgi:hypothetical protein